MNDLEFSKVRERLASYCLGPTAQQQMKGLVPYSNRRQAIQALEETAELLSIREEGVTFPRLEFEELGKDLKRLRMQNASLFLDGVIRIYQASLLVNELFRFFKTYDEDVPRLRSLMDISWQSMKLIDPVEKVLDKHFKVKDDASPSLLRIRQEMQSKRKQVNRNFDRLLKKMAGQGYLGESNESFLNGRRVLSALSSFKRSVPGRTLGGSRGGAVTYVEPQENIQLNMELDALAYDEEKEIERILAALSEEIRKEVALVESYQELLTTMDAIHARVRLAHLMSATLPYLDDEPGLDLVNAYHPLLLLNNKESGSETLPQSLRMDKGTRMLVISGPNAGGKSITLKTIGLLQVMGQSGLLIPADASSHLGWFETILSDIGDNQSIENQLSTYSYRLKRMKYFLDSTNEKSLLLLDEFGTGSDPELGGALAEVFFETIYQQGAFAVVTTHYANIKLKAAELQEAHNACMLFDTKTLEPRFKLSMGQPGSSFTFEVAQMNGIPMELIESAKSRLDNRKVEMDHLISSLQQDKAELEKQKERMRKAEFQAKSAEKEMGDTRQHYEKRLETQQKRIERNNKYLSSGKRIAQFIDEFELGKNNKELMAELKKFLTIEKTKLEEVRKHKEYKEKLEAKRLAEENRKRKKRAKVQSPVTVGSKVRLDKSNQRGEVIGIQGSEATVMFGAFKTKVGLDKLIVLE